MTADPAKSVAETNVANLTMDRMGFIILSPEISSTWLFISVNEACFKMLRLIVSRHDSLVDTFANVVFSEQGCMIKKI